MEVFENIIEKLEERKNCYLQYTKTYDVQTNARFFGKTDAFAESIEVVKQAAAECKKTLHETMIELLSGAWVDSDKVQAVFGLDFTECLSLLDFSRTAEWWSIAGKTEEERAREGQKIETRFRLKNNGWIPVSERLPEANQMVLATENDSVILCCYEFIEGHGYCFYGSNGNVVAWYKLPEPYQQKGENNENS